MSEPFGTCSICGVEGRLSFEHIPPKKAFNDRPVLTSHWQDLLNAGSREEIANVRKSMQRRGFGKHSLCERCNNNTGSWYGPSYVEWAQQ